VELGHLRSFVTVAEERHFGRAARRLHISQPPLSQQIRALEEELGVVLFERTSRSVVLTAPGQVFLRHAQAILRQVDEAAAHARRAGRGEAGHLDVGYCTSATHMALPDAIRAFRAVAPEVDVRLGELSSARQLELLAARRLDVGFVAPPRTAPAGVDVEVVMEDELAVALPAGHRLAARRRIAPTDLAGEDLVGLRRDIEPVWADVIGAWVAQAGALGRVVEEPDTKLAMLGLVAAGLGPGIVTASMAKVRREGVVFRAFTVPTARLELGLAVARPASPAAALFAATVRAVTKRARDRPRAGARSSYGNGRS
jgi:DNA-binding transcriptional LysR family regulator